MTEEKSETLVVLVAAASHEEANRLAEGAVEARLAACVNVIPGIRSVYRWKGAMEKAEETLLLMKTTVERYEELEALIKQLHSYETPEIIAVPVDRGSRDYCAWVSESVTK